MGGRNFLKNISLVGGLFATPSLMLPAASAAQPPVKDLSNLTLKGRVLNNAQAIAGVAVTDGSNVGPMMQRIAFDPWAVELYARPALPKAAYIY